MIKLSRRYDKEQNDSFWGFGKKRVYGSMLDYLRSFDVMSRANRRLFKTIEKEIEIYYNANGIEPNEEELAKILNEDIEKIRDARNASMIAITLPIDEQISLFEESSTEAIVEQDQL